MSKLEIGKQGIFPDDSNSGRATLNTTNFTSTSGGGVYYKVLNNICFVLITQISAITTGDAKVLATGLPTCSFYSSYPIWDSDIQNRGYCYIVEDATQIMCSAHNTYMFWASFCYPTK